MSTAHRVLLAPLSGGGTGGGIVPTGTRTLVFQQIYWVFLILGTLVGIVVVGYMVYNAYKYREGEGAGVELDVERPSLGELPTGSGGGKKLLLSFSLSTIIVVSLIGWTYGTLLYVEQPTHTESGETLDVTVEGYRFGWDFIYPNGHRSSGTLRVPVGMEVKLHITSRDVFHNFGIPELNVKADALPGQRTDTWFIADEKGEYRANCYELCGVGHSYMHATIIVMEESAYEAWYANVSTPTPTATPAGTPTESQSEGGH